MSKHRAIPICTLLALAMNAHAQCLPGWSAPTHPDDGAALDMAVFDVDGPGPARSVLICGGAWGRRAVDRYLVARYDGRAWRQLGEFYGAESIARAVCIANTTGVGSPAPGIYIGGAYFLTAGGPLRFLSHWDGSAWRDLPGIRGGMYSLHMFDEDGPGPNEPSLFVGGGIAEIAGLAKPGLVRWDGTSFSLVGGSLQPSQFGSCRVHAMTIFDDDGPGPRSPALYVAGSFQTAGGIVVNNIARWDGQHWEALGLGLGSGVDALAVFDADGDGPELPMLYAAGQFRTPGAWSRALLSRWDGQQWSEVPGYNGGGVESLYVFDDDGDGPNLPALFVGGLFNRVSGVFSPGAITWDGQQWHGLGSGLGGLTWAHATDFQPFDEDGDPATPSGLYVGGNFFTAGGLWSVGLARWGCAYPTCYADCEASTGLGTLDIFDFLCFQNSFVNGEPYACDCDTSTGPLVCDLFDFLCFQDSFVAGCP